MLNCLDPPRQIRVSDPEELEDIRSLIIPENTASSGTLNLTPILRGVGLTTGGRGWKDRLKPNE
jgi:hypothetical protein